MSKSIGEVVANAKRHSPLRRSLGWGQLVLIGVGSTVGGGIFVLTGEVAARYSGPAIVLSFLIASFACVFAGLCYAEFAAMIPLAGSAYTYAAVAYGNRGGWLIGWTLILEYLFAGGLVAAGWSGYFNSFLISIGVIIPSVLNQAPLAIANDGHIYLTGAFLNLPALLVTLLCGVPLYLGIHISSAISATFAALKILAILIIIFAAAQYIDVQNLVPFIPENTGTYGQYGYSGILRGAAVIFFAYIGFDAITTLAQETKRPSRDLPLSLILALSICTFLYVVVAIVVTGVVPYSELGVPDPIIKVLNRMGDALLWVKVLVLPVTILGLMTTLITILGAQIRIFYAMSRDKLLPIRLAAIHPHFQTPHTATVLTVAISASLASLMPLALIAELTSIGTLLVFAIVCLSVIVLRLSQPEAERPFRVPLYPLSPLIGAFSCLYLMFGMPWQTWIRLIGWLILGAVIYGLRSKGFILDRR